MQTALVNGQKMEPARGLRGQCEVCQGMLIAKCGSRIMHHWAHYRLRGCDSWSENETKWHREWKSRFPIDCREVVRHSDTGEIHRADICTPSGIYIEVQHSSISDEERISREQFYSNLIWVVDGRPFCKNFDIYHPLPDPGSDIGKDLVWAEAKRGLLGSQSGLCFKVSAERMRDANATKLSVYRSGGELFAWGGFSRSEVLSSFKGQYQYDWIKPRKGWLESECPVFIDFGGVSLLKLETYDSTGLKCIKAVSKDKFVKDALVKETATAVGL